MSGRPRCHRDVSGWELLFRPLYGTTRAEPRECRGMTRDQLRDKAKKELTEMARKRGISGWHDLNKDELVVALAAPVRKKPKPAVKVAKPSKAAVLLAAKLKKLAAAKAAKNGTA